MNNLFGKKLRSLMDEANIKESQLAEALSYDATYISKWINGNKLPSTRNVERIIGQMVDFFIAYAEGITTENRDKRWKEMYSGLNDAYISDSKYLSFQGYNNSQMSYIDHPQTFVQLTREALAQAMEINKGYVSIKATFDIFQLYGKEFKKIIQELNEGGAKKIELKLAILPDELEKDYLTCTTNILGIIGNSDYIEMTIVNQKMEQPHLVVINDLICMQILWNIEGEFSAIFSMEAKLIQVFSNMIEQINETSEKLLDPAEPESLKRTNVQLDSYAAPQQWHFFNEPPAMLFPEALMESLIAKTEDEEYANYLIKLNNVFAKHTSKLKVDLVIYSSMLNQYLSEGKISIGNVCHQLNEEQTRSHIRHLSNLIKENPDFHLYLIRDTVALSDEMSNSPSIFLDTYSVNIENSKKNPNDNYHISLDVRMRDAFQKFFEKIISQSFCTKLTAEDLLRYL